MFDLIIRGGTVIDGTGSVPGAADVAVRDGRIAAVEPDLRAEADEVLDARGRIVTPGFVDVHTHYDGQVTWDELLEPSSSHGVTTTIIGNCGVGFAPVRPSEHEALIELMEGVEDIPGAALWEGISWGWESFPQYLDALAGRRWSMDVGTHVPHGPVRRYVMGERAGADGCTTDDLTAMQRVVQEAVEAGAFGLTTSRTLGHRAVDGTPVPGTFAGTDELLGLGRAVAAGGGRILEVAGSGLVPQDDARTTSGELAWIGDVARRTGLVATFILLQVNDAPERWRHEMDEAAAWRAAGVPVVPLVAGRPFGILWGWDVRHPFFARDSYRAVAHRPLQDRLERLADGRIRKAILGQADRLVEPGDAFHGERIARLLPRTYVLTGTPDYEQHPDATLGARARREGKTIEEVAYDALLEPGSMLMLPLYNYAYGDHQALYEQLTDSDAVVGLDDGGAHAATVCDASIPTYLLTHWARDRRRGPRLPVVEMVRRLTSQPADLYGLIDRGRVEVGRRADLNVIDADALQLEMPRAVADLPAGGTRLLQGARGYACTMVAGEVTRRDGVDTGARPGRLLRRR